VRSATLCFLTSTRSSVGIKSFDVCRMCWGSHVNRTVHWTDVPVYQCIRRAVVFPFILSPGELVPLECSSKPRSEVIRQFEVKLTLYKTATMSLPSHGESKFLNLIRETAPNKPPRRRGNHGCCNHSQATNSHSIQRINRHRNNDSWVALISKPNRM